MDNELLRLSLRLFKRKTVQQGSGPDKTEDTKLSQPYVPEMCLSWARISWPYGCFVSLFDNIDVFSLISFKYDVATRMKILKRVQVWILRQNDKEKYLVQKTKTTLSVFAACFTTEF